MEKKVIAQNSASAEKILNSDVQRKELTPAEIEVNTKKEELKALQAKAKAERDALLAEIKAKQDEARKLQAEAKKLRDEEKARAKAEREANRKEKHVVYTRFEAMGETFHKFGAEQDAEKMIAAADNLYASKGGKSNLKETKGIYDRAIRFLKGYLSAE